MENLSKEELEILMAVECSEDSECDFDTLVRTVNLSEKEAEYYVSLLSFVRNYLRWIASSDPNEPDRYSLTNQGRKFLLERSHI